MQAQSIHNIGSGNYAKIYLEWEDPWWAPGEGGIQLAWPEQSSRNSTAAASTDLGETSSSGDDDDEADHIKPNDDHLRHWYRGISNFSEVDGQRNVLMCWVAGDSARIADRLDDEEVRNLFLVYHVPPAILS